MKNRQLSWPISLLMMLALSFGAGCSKDKCADITCKNGGVCNDGSCDCLYGYTGSRCETRLCEKNKTAQVKFQNKTGSSQTYSVVWDGSLITTLSPGSESAFYTVAAGQHTLHFLISNSSNEACTESTPVLLECSSMNYWCTL